MPSSQPDQQRPRSRQQQVGDALRQDTRERLIAAAAQEFPRYGYAGTTVSRLAATAGVSVQTLYLACGSKRALLRAWTERVLAGGRGSPADAVEAFSGLDPVERLAGLATLVAEVADRAGDAWKLYQDASAVDPEIADDWDELQRLRRQSIARIVSAIPVEVLADELTPELAADTAWVIASPESYSLLVHRLGCSSDEFRRWMTRTLVAAILSPSARDR